MSAESVIRNFSRGYTSIACESGQLVEKPREIPSTPSFSALTEYFYSRIEELNALPKDLRIYLVANVHDYMIHDLPYEKAALKGRAVFLIIQIFQEVFVNVKQSPFVTALLRGEYILSYKLFNCSLFYFRDKSQIRECYDLYINNEIHEKGLTQNFMLFLLLMVVKDERKIIPYLQKLDQYCLQQQIDPAGFFQKFYPLFFASVDFPKFLEKLRNNNCIFLAQASLATPYHRQKAQAISCAAELSLQKTAHF